MNFGGFHMPQMPPTPQIPPMPQIPQIPQPPPIPSPPNLPHIDMNQIINRVGGGGAQARENVMNAFLSHSHDGDRIKRDGFQRALEGLGLGKKIKKDAVDEASKKVKTAEGTANGTGVSFEHAMQVFGHLQDKGQLNI